MAERKLAQKELTVQDIVETPQSVEAIMSDSEMPEASFEAPKATLGSSFIYTLNHTLACTFYDIPFPFISAGASMAWDAAKGNPSLPYVDRVWELGHGHGHGHGGLGAAFWDKSKHWIKGEMAGDFGAILPAVAVQHYAPGFMGLLRKGIEPVIGPLFRMSANRAAKNQATAFGIGADADTIKQRADALYEHEMQHMPLAFVWTPLSAAINIVVQKKILGDEGTWDKFITIKAGMAALSTGTTFAMRSLAHGHVQKFEEKVDNVIISPAVRTAGKIAGVDGKKIDAVLQNGETPKEWADRVQKEKGGKEYARMS